MGSPDYSYIVLVRYSSTTSLPHLIMLIAIAIFCTLCEAVFTALEVALSTVSRARLRALVEAEHATLSTSNPTATSAIASGSASDHAAPARSNGNGSAQATPPRAGSALVQRAECVLRVLEHPERLTLVFIIVTSASLWTATTVLTWQALEERWPVWVLPLTLIGVLFVAEVLPLLVAARSPEMLALRGASIAESSTTILAPLLTVFGAMGRGMAWLLGAGTQVTPQVTEGELRTALATAEEEGVIESDERAMLEGAMDFRGKFVREVMTPRIDMVGTPADASLPEVVRLAMREGHARLPVYEGTLDKIIGIVATKDLIPYLRHAPAEAEHQHKCARDVMRPPYFVPENKLIEPTLEELRRQRTLMAVVVDADGGTAGLVTLEDLLEEIVGEIQDEYDEEEEPSIRIVSGGSVANLTSANSDGAGDGITATNGAEANAQTDTSTVTNEAELHAVECDPGVSVRDLERFWRKNFNETIRLQDEDGPVEASLSLAALALELFDGVPHPGDSIMAGNIARTPEPPVRLEIVAMDGPRIEKVRISEVKTAKAGVELNSPAV